VVVIQEEEGAQEDATTNPQHPQPDNNNNNNNNAEEEEADVVSVVVAPTTPTTPSTRALHPLAASRSTVVSNRSAASASTTSGMPCCRVCLDEVCLEDMVSGIAVSLNCDCRGPLAVCHVECARKWYNDVRHSNMCEICHREITNVPGVPPPRDSYSRRQRDNMIFYPLQVAPGINQDSTTDAETTTIGNDNDGGGGGPMNRVRDGMSRGFVFIWRSGWYLVFIVIFLVLIVRIGIM